MSKRSRSARGRGARTASRRRGRTPLRCGAPDCLHVGDHVVLDPTGELGALVACEEHWPDLVALIWYEGCWVSECPCPACTEGDPGGFGVVHRRL